MVWTEKKVKVLRITLLLILFGACLWAGRNGGGGDFEVLRTSVIRAWSNDLSHVYLKNVSGPFFYPPSALVFFAPFAIPMSWPSAILLNLVFHSLSFWALWWGLKQLIPGLYETTALRRWVLCFLFALAPIHLDFMGQNINLPLAAMLILTERLRLEKSMMMEFLAGFCSSLISWIKIFPAVMTVTYFLQGGRSMRRGILAGFFFGVLAPWVAFGKGAGELYLQFFETLVIYHDKNGITTNSALNFPGLIARWGDGVLPESLLKILIPGLPLIIASVFLVNVWLLRSPRENKSFQCGIWSMAMGLMVFLHSAARADYFMFYLPAFALCAADFKQQNSREKFLFLGSFVLIALTQQAIVGLECNIALQHARIPVIGMGMLLFALALRLKRYSQSALFS
jgi:hypothetical protein